MATTFAELELQKAEMLRPFAGWSEGRLRFRPAPGAWSVPEIVDHLVKVEAGILAEARIGLRAPHVIGIRDRLGVVFLDRVFRSDRRVRVPSSAKHVLPDTEPPFAAVRERWDVCRQELGEFLEDLAPEAMRGGVFRHPVAGWMSMPQVLDFFFVHLHHHGFQMRRLRDAMAPSLQVGDEV